MNLKKKLRKNWLIIVGLIILLIFFYPKHCGNWGTAIHPDAKYKDCNCIGLETNGYPWEGIRAGGSYLYCWGIPTSYSCYYYEGKEINGDWNVEKVDIPCD